MKREATPLLTALAATLLLALATTTASARRIQVSEQNFYVKWASLSFSEPLLFVEPIRCPVTLLGSFHSRTISKVCGQLIGYINHATVGTPANCTAGEVTILTATLPWHVRYQSFSGALPRITRVRLQLIGAAFRIHIASIGITCLYQTSGAEPALGDINVNETTGVVNNLEATNTAKIRLHEGDGACFEVIELRGVGSVVAGSEHSTTAITIRLVQ